MLLKCCKMPAVQNSKNERKNRKKKMITLIILKLIQMQETEMSTTYQKLFM